MFEDPLIGLCFELRLNRQLSCWGPWYLKHADVRLNCKTYTFQNGNEIEIQTIQQQCNVLIGNHILYIPAVVAAGEQLLLANRMVLNKTRCILKDILFVVLSICIAKNKQQIALFHLRIWPAD